MRNFVPEMGDIVHLLDPWRAYSHDGRGQIVGKMGNGKLIVQVLVPVDRKDDIVLAEPSELGFVANPYLEGKPTSVQPLNGGGVDGDLFRQR